MGRPRLQFHPILEPSPTPSLSWQSESGGSVVVVVVVAMVICILWSDARAETRLESFLQVLCSVAIPL